MKIRVLTIGGTIDKIYFDALSAYEVGEPQAPLILAEAKVAFEYAVERLLQKDSLELTGSDRALIRERVEAATERLILITHGTDTMAQTGAALKGIAKKVIVLTGAMQPAAFRISDAVFNIGCAIGALQSLPPGVYIVMNGCVFPVDEVRKNREAGRFESTKD